MQKNLNTLIATVRLAMGIIHGKPQEVAKPTGLLDPNTTQAPDVIIKLYNQCRKDRAFLENSDALVSLYEITDGKSETTRAYWKHADAFRQTVDSVEKLLTPLPVTPSDVMALMYDIVALLKDADTSTNVITETLIDIKAEVDQKATQ